MISIICCYNNETCLNNMLISSIERQKEQVDTILINNNEKKYKSAAEAYNNEIKKAKGDILIFCHQDIAFKNENFISEIQKIFDENKNIILGLAGIRKDGKVYSDLKYYETEEYITNQRCMEKIQQVESVDECFFAIQKTDFEKLKFDEEVCDSWHLYAVELCYKARENNIKSIVTNISAYHKMKAGDGLETDNNYLKSMNKLCKKYAGKHDVIYAPCYIISTNPLKRRMKIVRTKIKRLVKTV